MTASELLWNLTVQAEGRDSDPSMYIIKKIIIETFCGNMFSALGSRKLCVWVFLFQCRSVTQVLEGSCPQRLDLCH